MVEAAKISNRGFNRPRASFNYRPGTTAVWAGVALGDSSAISVPVSNDSAADGGQPGPRQNSSTRCAACVATFEIRLAYAGKAGR